MAEQAEIYAIEDGALVDVPVYHQHRRAKNWFARITADPSAPSGLGRQFAERANGRYYYMVPSWAQPGTPIEFGADYYSGSGRKNPRRAYGVITAVTDQALHLIRTDDAQGALELSQQEVIIATEAVRIAEAIAVLQSHGYTITEPTEG